MNREKIESLALRYAEKYGIIEYRVKGNSMIYNVSYPAYLYNKRYTIQHEVNLITGDHKSVTLKRYEPKGALNRR